ncbi:MAG: radical SAM protein, partial [Thermoplasmatota archaeon]
HLRRTFQNHQKAVREKFDQAVLREVIPVGTVLKEVFLEKVEPGITYGRQIATYALLVGVAYETEVDRFVDILVTDHGYRSITGIPTPFDVPGAGMKALAALPGIGKKRAVDIKVQRPASLEEFSKIVQDDAIVSFLAPHLAF